MIHLSLGPWAFTLGLLLVGFCGIMLMGLTKNKRAKKVIMVICAVIMMFLVFAGMH